MKTVCITDGRYRSALAAARSFARAGYRVVVTQTRGDEKKEPPVFASVCAEGRWIEGRAADPDYPDRLLAMLKRLAAEPECDGKPILFCVGAVSLNRVAQERERFAAAADFLMAPPSVLDSLNDKQTVHERCAALGIPVPKAYGSDAEDFPLIVKPRCGEKAGLKAKDRYRVVRSQAELRDALAAVRPYDPEPVIQEKVSGSGFGVSLLLGRDSELLGAICHRRIREYPYSGGPSTCCVSCYDPEKIRQAHALLKSFGFVGLAMVEFKGDRVLEVNPRIWGSFPLTAICGSPICARYAQAASGAFLPSGTPDDRTGVNLPAWMPDYRTGVKLRFFFNDLAACADLLRHGKLRRAGSALLDCFRVREALNDPEDKKAYRRYLRSYLPFRN